MKKTLRNHPFANAYTITTNNTISLVSYATVVAAIDPDGYLTVFGLYSATTRKHIGYFLKEYASKLHYSDAHDAFEYNYKINIYNGDIVELI